MCLDACRDHERLLPKPVLRSLQLNQQDMRSGKLRRILHQRDDCSTCHCRLRICAPTQYPPRGQDVWTCCPGSLHRFLRIIFGVARIDLCSFSYSLYHMLTLSTSKFEESLGAELGRWCRRLALLVTDCFSLSQYLGYAIQRKILARMGRNNSNKEPLYA